VFIISINISITEVVSFVVVVITKDITFGMCNYIYNYNIFSNLYYYWHAFKAVT